MNETLMISPHYHVTRPRCSAETETGTRCKNLVSWGNYSRWHGWRGYCGKHPAPDGSELSTAWAYLPADVQAAIRGAG